MGAKKQTIGYHYFFSILFGIGRGPIDELRAIKVGEKMAWEGSSCDNGTDTINKPELFGGEKREGGIQGAFRLQQGKADQKRKRRDDTAQTFSAGCIPAFHRSLHPIHLHRHPPNL